MCDFRPLFLFFVFSIQMTVTQMFHINVCRWLDLNLRPLVSEATALQTEPQLLHSDNDVTHNVPYVCFNVRITSKNFCRFSWFQFFEIFAIRLTSWSDKRHLQLTFNLESVGSFIQINGFGFLFKLPGRQAGRQMKLHLLKMFKLSICYHSLIEVTSVL